MKYYTTVFHLVIALSSVITEAYTSSNVTSRIHPLPPLSSRRDDAPKQSIQRANLSVALTDCFTVYSSSDTADVAGSGGAAPINTRHALQPRCSRRRTGSWLSSPPPAPASSRTRTAGRRRRDYRLRPSPRPRQTWSFSCGASGICTGCRARSRSRRRWRREARCAGCLRWMDGRMDSKREESGEMRTARKIGRDDGAERNPFHTANGRTRFELGARCGRTGKLAAAARGQGPRPPPEHVLTLLPSWLWKMAFPVLGLRLRGTSGGEGRSEKLFRFSAPIREGRVAAVGFRRFFVRSALTLGRVGEAHGDASKDATVAVRRARGALVCR